MQAIHFDENMQLTAREEFKHPRPEENGLRFVNESQIHIPVRNAPRSLTNIYVTRYDDPIATIDDKVCMVN